jgi:hypothetical protein
MGMSRKYINFINNSVKVNFENKKRLTGLSMVELGDQVINDPSIPFKTGKDYFSSRNFKHISVDLNGLHGSQVRDLRKPEQFNDLEGKFDVLTNLGTTEHVEPYEYQYTCFKIIHRLVKKGGVMIHIVPDINLRNDKKAWVDHCRVYYSEKFFLSLARDCNYQILEKKYINDLLSISMVKKGEDFSISKKNFYNHLFYLNYENRFKHYLLEKYRVIRVNLSRTFKLGEFTS